MSKTIPFAWDQERDAVTVARIINTHTPTLIGPRVVGENGFYLGPYFFYLLLPFYVLSSLHPIAIVYFVFFTALLFFVFSFISIKKIFNKKYSLIFLFIWGILPLMVNIDRIAWNPLLIPLCFSVILLLLGYLKNTKTYFTILGVVLGLGFHLHFQALFYLVFTLVYLIKLDKKYLRKIPWLFMGFFITFIPLFIFDLRHNFLNSHLFISFFFSGSHPSSLLAFLPVWTNIIAKLTGVNNLLFSLSFWLFLVTICFRNRHLPFFMASIVILLLTPIAFAIYGQRPSEYYFVYLLPIIVMISSHLISKISIKKPLVLVPLIIVCVFFSLKQIKTDSLSLYNKDQIVKTAKNTIKETSVYISYEVPLGQNTGFDYLIDYYQINRSQDTTRPGVQFQIPKRNSLPSSGNISLFVPEL